MTGKNLKNNAFQSFKSSCVKPAEKCLFTGVYLYELSGIPPNTTHQNSAIFSLCSVQWSTIEKGLDRVGVYLNAIIKIADY